MTSNPAPRRPQNGWKRPVLIVAGVAVLAVGGWFAWPSLFGNGNPAAGLQFATVQRGDIEDVVTATGTLQPRDYVDVGAQVSGQLKKIHVEVGSVVKAGELLAEIDPTVYLSRVDAARAQLRNLRAQLKDRESQLLLAQIQLRRQTALMAEDATTTESLQIAEASLKSAEASLEALRAQIEQNESSLRADEASLQYARILSPMAGTVVSITARQGQTLNTNQSAPVILRVADLSTMTVQTQVSEADVSRLKVGMEAYFTTLGGQGKRWYGKLDKIEPTPTVTNNVVLYNALFDVLNPDARLMTQMTAQVYFIIDQAKDVLQIPMGALTVASRAQRSQSGTPSGTQPRTGPSDDAAPARAQDNPQAGARRANNDGSQREGRRPTNGAQAGEPRPRQATVQLLKADNTLEQRAITIGVTNRVQAQVLSGLEEGDKVASGLAAGATSGTRASGPTPPGPRL
ncbi:MAG: efflux RND transporter periplasmic adaptor subunit [Azoarcus sp.]|nr:efflux RND transporter periplasmic adaptor subunit [Azoarcus sp.]